MMQGKDPDALETSGSGRQTEAEKRVHGNKPSGEDRSRANEAQAHNTRRVPRTAAVIDFAARELYVSGLSSLLSRSGYLFPSSVNGMGAQ